jgi:hypothetical protein
MTFKPDSPLNRLILLWPGVPIAACGLGFLMALLQVGTSHDRAFAALAIAMGMGFILSLGLLFHTFFAEWLEVSVTREGLWVRPVGMTWLNARPELLTWSAIEDAHQVVTRDGGHLEIAASGRVFRLERALFREDTFADLWEAISLGSAVQPLGYEGGLAAAA